jgi:glycosyl-4,4'-diaponeurosporenoate acyltransferase
MSAWGVQSSGKVEKYLLVSNIVIIFLNILVWLVIHLGVSYWAFKRPLESFNRNSFLYKVLPFERDGRFYQKVLKIRAWKRLLPDGAGLMRMGFPMRLDSTDPAFIDRFYHETFRSEWAHWVTMAFTPVFFIWNPAWACMVMVIYALASNLPCIVVQRYNRVVFRRIFKHLSKS